MAKVLVLYYSMYGHIETMAHAVAEGAQKVDGVEVTVKRVPETMSGEAFLKAGGKTQNTPQAAPQELADYDAIIFGTPTRFGNMAAPLKYFLDGTSNAWVNGDLIDKPAAVFTSTSTLHGGQESTLLSMMLPLIHQGMLITGIPYSEAALSSTKTGGSPYGASHLATGNNPQELSADEITLCQALGKRVAKIALQLGNK